MGNYAGACSGEDNSGCCRHSETFHDARTFGKRRENIRQKRDKTKRDKFRRQLTDQSHSHITTEETNSLLLSTGEKNGAYGDLTVHKAKAASPRASA